jgi:hypothetical protein
MATISSHYPNYGTLNSAIEAAPEKRMKLSSKLYLVAFSVSVVALLVIAVAYPVGCLSLTPYNSKFFADALAPGDYRHANNTVWCERHINQHGFQSIPQCINILEHQHKVDKLCWSLGGKISGVVAGAIIILNIIGYCALITPVPSCNFLKKPGPFNMDPLPEAIA